MKTKLLSCILLSAMALGATQAFAQKLEASVAAKEDLMTFEIGRASCRERV